MEKYWARYRVKSEKGQMFASTTVLLNRVGRARARASPARPRACPASLLQRVFVHTDFLTCGSIKRSSQNNFE